jgi:NAD(P)-dependent dehydrogenase (short-subunit alcohol dehydrogenase family)
MCTTRQLLTLFRPPPANVFYQECDITDADAVLAAAATIKQHFGKSPSILYNNAGMIQSGSVPSTSPSRVAKLIAVNLTSHWHTCQAWVPDMIANNKGN